jgi:hypothetical protein
MNRKVVIIMSSFVRNIGGSAYTDGDSESGGGSSDSKVVRFITITKPPNKLEYVDNEPLNTSGLIISAIFANGNTEIISDYTTSPANEEALTLGNNTVTVTYTDQDGYELTTSFNIKYITGIIVTSPPDQIKYYPDDGNNTLDLTGMIVSALCDDNSTTPITDYTTSLNNGDIITLDTDSNITIRATIDGTEFTTTQEIFIVSAVSYWATSTTEDIARFLKCVDKNIYDIKSYWVVGDERDITMGNSLPNTTYVVMDLDGTTSGGTKYHAVVGEKNSTIIKDWEYDSNNDGAYHGYTYNTAWSKYFTDTYVPAFPEDILSLIIPSDHMCGYVNESKEISGEVITGVYFIIPSEKEVFGADSKGFASPVETAACKQFEWYKTSANRSKNVWLWWLRSVYVANWSLCPTVYGGNQSASSSGMGAYLAPFACI